MQSSLDRGWETWDQDKTPRGKEVSDGDHRERERQWLRNTESGTHTLEGSAGQGSPHLSCCCLCCCLHCLPSSGGGGSLRWWEGRGQGTGRGGSRGAGAWPVSITVIPGHVGEQSPPHAVSHRPQTQAVTQSHAVSHTVPLTETRAQRTVSHAVLHRACSSCSFSCTIYSHTHSLAHTHRAHGHTSSGVDACTRMTQPPLPTVPVTLCHSHTHTH